MFLLCVTGLLIGSLSSVQATPANRTEKQGTVVLPPANRTRKKQNWFYFVLSPPLNSRVKNKTSFNFFSTIGFICSQLKKINKINEKILYSVGFTKPAS